MTGSRRRRPSRDSIWRRGLGRFWFRIVASGWGGRGRWLSLCGGGSRLSGRGVRRRGGSRLRAAVVELSRRRERRIWCWCWSCRASLLSMRRRRCRFYIYHPVSHSSFLAQSCASIRFSIRPQHDASRQHLATILLLLLFPPLRLGRLCRRSI